MHHDDDILRNAAPRLIVFTGAAGAGKSTARDALLRGEQAAQWAHVSFAAPLKEMLRALFAYQRIDTGLIRRMIDGDLKNTPVPFLNDSSPRHAMQTLGTEWGRNLIHPALWIDIASQRITDARNAGYNVVVDDCRFQNEADMLDALGAKFIRIEGRGGINSNHPSERGVANCHVTITNTGTIEKFVDTVRHEVLT